MKQSMIIVNTFGRVMLASLFILGGLNKIFNFAETVLSMESAGMVFANGLLPFVILLELVAGTFIAFARPGYRWAALALAGFTLLTNIFFHDFWTMSGLARELELSLFFKNISIAGALIFIASLPSAPTKMASQK